MCSPNSTSVEQKISRHNDNVVILTKTVKIRQFFGQNWYNLKAELRHLCTFHPNDWRNAFRPNPIYPIFRKGDIDGLVALFIDNMATLLTIILSILTVLDTDIVYEKIVPGVALAMLWGNFYYVYMARRLAYKEKRDDICAMPYGINTPGAFAFVFGIIFPVYKTCIQGHNSDKRSCQELALYIALAANFLTGIIIVLLCLVGEFIRRNIPGVALLSSLSAVGFTHLALSQYLPIAASPIVSFLPFAIVMIGYFSGIKVGPFPIAIIALVIGTSLGWATSLNKSEDVRSAALIIKAYAPQFTAQAVFTHINKVGPFLSTTIPTAVSIAISSIQCVESAKRAGDFYPTRESMFVDGIGTIIASFFGSFHLGMTTYIGHPAYKKMGARQAYSVINCLIYLPLCFFGIIALFLRVIAVVAVNPVIIFIGLFICAETLAITPKRHYPAFLIGLMPVIADWSRTTIINGVSSAYSSFLIPNVDFTTNVTSRITDFSYQGLNNFAGGSLLQCIFITAIMIYMIDRKFIRATIWSIMAGLLSFFGLIHASVVGVLYREADDGWKFTVAYAMLAIVFFLFELAQRCGWVQQPETEPDDLSSEEWAEWNKQQLAVQRLVENTTV